MLKRILLHLRSAFFLWNLLILILVSWLGGFLVVTHGHPEKFFQLFSKPGLFSSVNYSASIAFVLLLMIYVVSFIGNVKYAGVGRNGKWFLFQMTYGVLLTVIFEILFATLLFWYKGHWILNTAFFDKIFVLAVSFICIANLAYLLFFIQRVKIEPEIKRVEVPTIRYQPMPLVVPVDTVDNVMVSGDEAALFYIRNGEIWKKDFEGKRGIWLMSLDATMKELDHEMYFKCARNWIVNRHAVAEVIPISSRRLLIRCHFQVRIELVVSQRNAQDFKDWFYGDS